MLIPIDPANLALIDALAHLTFWAFKVHAPNWLPSEADARRQVLSATAPDRINRVLLSPQATPLGWIGVMPINQGRIWEIHPLAIAPDQQGHGYGRMLVQAIERLATERGVLGLLAGTGDTTGATPLYGMDLYQNPCAGVHKLSGRENHPVTFWQKIGFTIVGVVPDAEGRGKPAITLAKRIG